MNTLDLTYAQAKPVIARTWTRLRLVLVGCGGTGSWLAPSIVRLAVELLNGGKAVEVTFIDPDRVETKNIPRQNFCGAELISNKAKALAVRYGMAWGLDIRAIPDRFEDHHLPPSYGYDTTLNVVVGCVDNAAARKSIAAAVRQRNEGLAKANHTPQTWWLDCGNASESGQVLLGAAPSVEELAGAFSPPSVCRTLPYPALQRPELLEALPEELTDTNLSCAEMAVLNAQSLMVNQAVAAVAADYLLRLLVTGDLRKFATYLDLAAGSARSLYTTPEAVAASCGKTPEVFAPPSKAKKSA
jgi:PRTRC genetic system ThiF family protein